MMWKMNVKKGKEKKKEKKLNDCKCQNWPNHYCNMPSNWPKNTPRLKSVLKFTCKVPQRGLRTMKCPLDGPTCRCGDLFANSTCK